MLIARASTIGSAQWLFVSDSAHYREAKKRPQVHILCLDLFLNDTLAGKCLCKSEQKHWKKHNHEKLSIPLGAPRSSPERKPRIEEARNDASGSIAVTPAGLANPKSPKTL
jgi:hypothetical protein